MIIDFITIVATKAIIKAIAQISQIVDNFKVIILRLPLDNVFLVKFVAPQVVKQLIALIE